MKLTTKLFLGTAVALIFAGCSSRNTDTLQKEMQGMTGKNGGLGNSSSTLNIAYSANPSNVGEEVTVTVDLGNEGINCGKITLQTYKLNGDIVPYDTPLADWTPVNPGGDIPVDGVYEFSFTPTVAGEYHFRARYNSNGRGCSHDNVDWTDGDPLVVGCSTEFTGEAISCGESREATYTFTSADALEDLKIQGGLTNFTGNDAVITVSGGDLATSQWTPGGSSNRVISVTGSVEACEIITINITWNSSNSGGVITGEWTAKDNGVEVAPEIPGLTCE